MTLKDTIVEGYLEGKAKDVICLDLRNIDGAVSDFFIVGALQKAKCGPLEA